jgi:hypothetical protein
MLTQMRLGEDMSDEQIELQINTTGNEVIEFLIEELPKHTTFWPINPGLSDDFVEWYE